MLEDFHGNLKEYPIRMIRSGDPRVHAVMQFNKSLNVNFRKWSNVKMTRDAKMIDKTKNLTNANVGDAITIMRDAVPKKYTAETKAWRMEVGSLKGKKFHGNRRDGLHENAKYFIFALGPDGVIEGFLIDEWYNFSNIDRYGTANAEDAEKELNNRADALYYCSMMLNKNKPAPVVEKEEAKAFQITGEDDFMDTDDEENDSGDQQEVRATPVVPISMPTQKRKGRRKSKKKKKTGNSVKVEDDIEEEAFEESDDGDGEGREMDYGTSSSDDEPNETEVDIKSVAEESAQNGLLVSDEEEGGVDTEQAAAMTMPADKNKTADAAKESESKSEASAANASGFGTGNFSKTDNHAITEAEVRRYLMRKPITPTDLLLKFRNKRDNVSGEKLLETLTEIIKNLKPTQKIMQGKMYLSL